MGKFEVDYYSLCVTPLELFCCGHRIATATGFFWFDAGKIYLVSNWHAFSGRTPKSGQPIRKDGAIPDRISFVYYCSRTSQIHQSEIKLTDEDGIPIWLQHSFHGQDIDVAALNITDCVGTDLIYENFHESVPVCVNTLPAVSDAKIQIALDLYILGYPLGFQKTSIFPVWKRASVASEPLYDLDGIPFFYVDSATREGMSGSPVIFRANWYQTQAGPWSMKGLSTQFIGIYSGRHIGSLEEEAHLGIVWRGETLSEIIKAQKCGEFALR